MKIKVAEKGYKLLLTFVCLSEINNSTTVNNVIVISSSLLVSVMCSKCIICVNFNNLYSLFAHAQVCRLGTSTSFCFKTWNTD